MVPFCPVPFCPTVPFCPNIPCSILPPRLRLGKSHYVNYNIGRCSIKWYENENKRYIIIFNHMQWFYYLICQSNWCHNASKLIYQRVKFRFCEILKTWSIANLISMCDAELADDRNQMDVKIDPHQAWLFSKHPVFHFAPMFHFAPTYYITISLGLKPAFISWFNPKSHSQGIFNWGRVLPAHLLMFLQFGMKSSLA